MNQKFERKILSDGKACRIGLLIDGETTDVCKRINSKF